MKVVAVIPARFAATRLPGKPLADICGRPMIQWVYERAKRAAGVDRVIVATDDPRIDSVVRGFGGECQITSPELPSGTDRVAAVADLVEADVYLNVQGDEPMIDPRAITRAAEIVTSGRFQMGTIMVPLRTEEELHDRAAVKVIADRHGRALYFSRLPIPYGRLPGPEKGQGFVCRKHVGLYSYTRETLFRIRALKPSLLEKSEMLEQLRAMEDGVSIGIEEMDFSAIGVDTPEDLEKVRKLLASL